MSLVERALKKMQAAARSAAEQPADPNAPARFTGARTAGGVGAHAGKLAPGIVGELVRPSAPQPGEVDPASLAPAEPAKWIRVDRQALRQEGLLAPEHQERLLADQFRQIKRPLIASAIGRGVPRTPNGQVIMMASALAGEGKTFTSINLALSMALDRDISVLLIDADVAKPHITRTFGAENEPGLLDLLRDESLSVGSLILQTDVPGLSILPSGRKSDTAAELLASHRMANTIAALAESDPNRIILIDSSPLLLTNESRVLSHIAGQIVMVVRAGMTPQRAVLDALDYLEEEKPVSFVLNQARTLPTTGYYSYPDAGTAAPA
jgi:protein-tyrosine kinase